MSKVIRKRVSALLMSGGNGDQFRCGCIRQLYGCKCG